MSLLDNEVVKGAGTIALGVTAAKGVQWGINKLTGSNTLSGVKTKRKPAKKKSTTSTKRKPAGRKTTAKKKTTTRRKSSRK